MDGPVVHVWIVDVDDEASARTAFALLPAAERIRLGLRAQPHRRRAVCAQAALRLLTAAASTGVLPLPQLEQGPNGKPGLAAWGWPGHHGPAAAGPRALGRPDPPAGTGAHGGAGCPEGAGHPARFHCPLQLGLAHSGTLAAIALTTAGITGVDIEQVRALPDSDGLARTAMSGAEYQEWLGMPAGERDAGLFRAWTRKEAVLKALGTGLGGDLRAVESVRLGPARGRSVALRALPPEAGEPDRWTVLDLPDPPPGYAGAVAVRAPAATVVQHRTSIADLLPSDRSRPPRRPARTEGDPAMDAPTRGAPIPGAGPQIFCLPHAGGNAQHFTAWSHWTPPPAEVVPVDLPGHGTRLREPLTGDWHALVQDLTATVAARLTAPYVLFGHSLGALLAYEVARTLQRRGTPPALLVVAGRNGPSAGLSHRPIHDLPDAAVLGELRRLGGIADGLLHQPELLAMFLPGLRTDLKLAETYVPAPGPPLSCPITVFAGRQDRMTDEGGVLAWQRATTGSCEFVFLDGGHFFLAEPEFTRALAARLAGLGAAAVPASP